MPSRTQIKGAGGFPFPTQHQYAHPWHHAGKGAQPGAKLMIDNGAQPAEDWTWMQTTGYAMRCQQVPARPPVEISNRFAAMESEEPEVPHPPAKSAGLPSAPTPTPGTRKFAALTTSVVRSDGLTCPTVIGCGRDQCGSQDPRSEAPAPPAPIEQRPERPIAMRAISRKCYRGRAHRGRGWPLVAASRQRR